MNFLFLFSVSRGPDCKNVNDDLFDQNFGGDDDHNEIYDDGEAYDVQDHNNDNKDHQHIENYNSVIAWKDWIVKIMKQFDEKEDSTCKKIRKTIEDYSNKHAINPLDKKIFLNRVFANFKKKDKDF